MMKLFKNSLLLEADKIKSTESGYLAFDPVLAL